MVCISILIFLFSGHCLAEDKGLLWKIVSPNGNISYLLGTIHSDDTSVTDFSELLQKDFAECQVFMLEALPPKDPSIFMNMNNPISEKLTEKEFDKVRELADFHSMHIEAAMHMKPWLLAIIFDLPKPATMYSMDELLFGKAIEQGKRIDGLEKTEDHYAVLDSFSVDEQMTMLKAVLNHSQEDKQRDLEILLNTYKTGDLVKIAELDDKFTGSMLPKPLWQKMRVKLIDERNEEMTEGFANAARENSVFAAVGATHLSGERGMLSLLRAKGFHADAIE